MAILTSRDELIPVTCAVLKDDVRKDFFAALKKKAGGKMERIAKACGATSSLISAWANGDKKIPYHALQRLVSEFGMEAPEVSELRKEFQHVADAPKKKRPITSSPPAPQRTEKPRAAQAAPPAHEPAGPASETPASRLPQEPRPKRGGRRSRKKTERPAASTPAAPAAPDKLTNARAYWAGVLLARARRNGATISLAADRRMSQNFAATWAILTVKAFGIKPELAMSDDRTVQTASLPAAQVAAFLERVEFGPATEPGSAPGAPRWVWSNPEWKKAFLRGLVDASAELRREPALRMTGLSEKLARSAQKMLASLELPPKLGEENTVVLEGADAVRKYFDLIGTDNPKLRDQFGVHFKTRGSAAGESPAPESSRPPRGRRRGRRGRGNKNPNQT